MSFARKVSKALQSVKTPLGRRALRFGTAPSFEHRDLLQSLGPMATVVDVGANTGQFAMICLQTFPEARIHSFEPLQRPAEVFRKVLSVEPRVTLHQVALGATPTRTSMHVTARDDSSSLLKPGLQTEMFAGTNEVRTEEIEVVRLSDVLVEPDIKAPAILKIDVQGFEGEVLKGCESLLGRFDWIYCEVSFVELYKGQALASEILEWLRQRGFYLTGAETDAEMRRYGRSVQADLLFARTGTSTSNS
jgi:FkbM family methyltransferase